MRNLLLVMTLSSSIPTFSQIPDTLQYNLDTTDKRIVAVYDILGKKVDSKYKGVVVYQYQDGTYKKAYLKR